MRRHLFSAWRWLDLAAQCCDTRELPSSLLVYSVTLLVEQSIGPGERFELCKSQVKTGQRRSIEWSVRRLDPERAAHEKSEVMEIPETQLESDLRFRRHSQWQKWEGTSSAPDSEREARPDPNQ